MTKGYSITIALPSYVRDYIKALAEKMATIPISNPETGEIVLNPQTKKPMPMVNTGTVEELIHQCILYNIYPLVLSHPAFVEDKKTIETFREEYGKYISSLIQKHFLALASNPQTATAPATGSAPQQITQQQQQTTVTKTVTKGHAKKKG